MKRILLFMTMVAVATSIVSCSQQRRWNEREREELRRELRAYRDMIYLDNLAEAEFDAFSGNVVEAIEIDYPIYTTFIELPGRGDTVDIYVVSTIVEELSTNPHNIRNIYPYPMLVEEGILPSGLNHQAQRAFYDCFSRKVKQYYPSTLDFFNAVIGNDASQATITDMQMQCAADLFDWGIVFDETVMISE